MSEFDTGVEELQVAAANGSEGISEDFTPPLAPEEPEPEVKTFASFFEDADKGNADKKGSDSPPEQPPKETEQPAPVYRTQADFDKAFAKRLAQEKAKLQREYEQKYATDPEVIEGKARKMMEQFPDDVKSIEFAKRLVQQEMAAKPPVQPEVEAETADAPDAEQQRFEAWKQSLTDEEPLLKLETGNPNFTVAGYANENPAFKAALKQGLTPMMAYAIVKEMEAQAVAAAEQNVLSKIKDSNAKAPASATKPPAQGKHMSDVQRMNNMSDDKFREYSDMLKRAAERGERILISD